MVILVTVVPHLLRLLSCLECAAISFLARLSVLLGKLYSPSFFCQGRKERCFVCCSGGPRMWKNSPSTEFLVTPTKQQLQQQTTLTQVVVDSKLFSSSTAVCTSPGSACYTFMLCLPKFQDLRDNNDILVRNGGTSFDWPPDLSRPSRTCRSLLS